MITRKLLLISLYINFFIIIDAIYIFIVYFISKHVYTEENYTLKVTEVGKVWIHISFVMI